MRTFISANITAATAAALGALAVAVGVAAVAHTAGAPVDRDAVITGAGVWCFGTGALVVGWMIRTQVRAARAARAAARAAVAEATAQARAQLDAAWAPLAAQLEQHAQWLADSDQITAQFNALDIRTDRRNYR
ncbi:hypothetical protein [Catellatospora sp. NPDC049609]|uniref:hypothetical protein n=1 Tax=Catellatospora sp. NPDC049609 TaxID=3155505 RepID=UPI0034438B0E